MPGLRLIPQYHGYSLADVCAAEIANAATDRRMVVSFSGRIVDHRYRHRMDQPWEIKDDQITALFKATPKARYLLVNFLNVPGGRRWDKPAVWMDICRFSSAPSSGLARAVETCGDDRMVFGTSMLFRYAAPALLSMELLKATKRAKERIYFRNLARLLNIRAGRPKAGKG